MATDEIMKLADAYATRRIGEGTAKARAALLKAVEQLAVDAARYRWLRESCKPHEVEYEGIGCSFGQVQYGIAFSWLTNWFVKGVRHTNEKTLDAAIDAARKETP